LPDAKGGTAVARYEARVRGELQCDAGEVLRYFCKVQEQPAPRGVVDQRLAAAEAGEHDEVVEVPVQEAGRLQRTQAVQVEAQGAAAHPQPFRHVHQLAEGRAIGGNGEAQAHLAQAHVLPVVGGDHREAGEAAFGRSRLEDQVHRSQVVCATDVGARADAGWRHDPGMTKGAGPRAAGRPGQVLTAWVAREWCRRWR
jgi:hypothetical protein